MALAKYFEDDLDFYYERMEMKKNEECERQ